MLTGARIPQRLNRRRMLQGSLGLAGATAFALACGGKKETTTTAPPAGAAQTVAPAGAAAAQPKRGGRLKLVVGITTTNLNPITNWNEGTILSGVLVYDRLVSIRLGMDSARQARLEAAQSVEMPDPTTVIFKLKPGMKYHNRPPVNGRAVEAEDIVKTQHYIRDNPAAQDRSFQTNSMQSVEAPDAQTVVFKLKAPNAYLFSGTQMSYPAGGTIIVPRETLDNLDQGWQVGSGPYELAEYEMNNRYLYRRFEGYREAPQGRPYIDEREYRIVIDPAAQEAAFRSEQAHIWGVPLPSIADQLKKDLGNRIVVDEFLSLSMVTLSFNVTKPPWNDVRVREAMYRFIDRKQYLDLLESGRGAIPTGTLSVGLQEYQLEPSQTEKYWRRDLRAARQLLEAAGYDFNREVEMSTITGLRNNQGMEIFQQQAAQVGMKVRIQPMPFAEWLNQKILSGNWEAWYSQHPTYDSPHLYLRLQHTNTGSVHRYNGLKDPEVDRMIEKAEVTLDRNERIKLVKDIQIALLEKYTPFVITHNYMAYTARWAYVRDFELNPASTAQPTYQTQMWLDK
jgi:peptide/nickel transport system substrate-binding protein